MSPSLAAVLLRAQPDERLAALARDGGKGAFTVLVERHRPALLAFARTTAGAERAEDIVQQSLLQAWSALRGGAEVHHVRGWLYQIVRHACWRAFEQPTCAEMPPTLAGSDDLHASLERRMQVRQMVEHVGALPEQQRAALVQTALEGRSRAEVATSLGVTEGAVRQLVHRGRARLRQAAAGVVPVPLLRWLAGAAERAGRVDEAAGGVAVATGTVAAGAKIAAAVLAAGALTVGAGAEIRHLRDAPAGRLAERATGPVDASSSGARPSTGASTTSTDRAVGRSGATTVSRSTADGPGRGPSAQPPASSREPVELARVTTPAVGEAPAATAAPRPDRAADGAGHAPGGEADAGDGGSDGADSSQRGDQASATESTGVSSDAPASGARSPDGTAPAEGSAAVGDRDAAQQQPPTEE
jgi:RNA polymerase sigma factor (sigma-70 family)